MTDDAITITLGGVNYETPRFNLGQLRQIAHLTEDESQRADVPFTILGMALKRATPPIENEDALLALEPYPGEFAVAMKLIMVAAGLSKKDAPAGEAPAPQGAV